MVPVEGTVTEGPSGLHHTVSFVNGSATVNDPALEMNLIAYTMARRDGTLNGGGSARVYG